MYIAVSKTIHSSQSVPPFWRNNPQMQRAFHWIRRNPEAWHFIVNLAKREASLQRRTSIQWIIEETRRRRFKARNGQPLGINNRLSPAFARLLILEVPEIRPYIKTRCSSVDDLRHGYL